MLTAGAGLLITSFSRLLHTDAGFNPDHLTTMFFELPDAHYKDTRPQFYRDYFEKLRALPGVQSAAGAIMLPMTQNGAVISFEDPEHPTSEGQQPSADLNPDHVLSISASCRFLCSEGRDFSERDDAKTEQVMIVNQAFAEKFFPGESVLGKKMKPGAGNGTPGGPPWREIVGVVGNIRLGATQRDMRPAMYLPASQLKTWCCLYSVVRTSLDPTSLGSKRSTNCLRNGQRHSGDAGPHHERIHVTTNSLNRDSRWYC